MEEVKWGWRKCDRDEIHIIEIYYYCYYVVKIKGNKICCTLVRLGEARHICKILVGNFGSQRLTEEPRLWLGVKYLWITVNTVINFRIL